jgi:hypothetical protein
MRLLPSRYFHPSQPLVVKKGGVSRVSHFAAPLKGLNLSTALTPGDPLTAPILTNFYVEEDRITCRAGFRKVATMPGLAPIWHLVPHYGEPERLLAATNHTLCNAVDGTLVRSGFTSDDWHWTSFANLAQKKYTVMVNGADGVWSWDGGLAADGAAVSLAAGAISKADPAVVTVTAGEIGNFHNGMDVRIAGAIGDFAVCNGNHIIASVGTPPNTFTLPGIDTSAATGTSAAGTTATPLGSFIKETVTATPGENWINPDQFQIVVSHMNRLFFADNTNLAIYYLPIQQKTGEVSVLPMNAMFRRGGAIRALATWSIDGGTGMDDMLVCFSTNGEAVIWRGLDPDEDFTMVGIFRFDAPMSKHCVINYGGDLYALIPTGVVPMTTTIRSETENLGKEDKSVISYFLKTAINFRDRPGWELFLNPSTGRLFANIPTGAANGYDQMIRHMPQPLWSQFKDVPARTWNWLDPFVYFGDDFGAVYEMHPKYQSDDGQPIVVDVQTAWNLFKTASVKHFKMLYPHIITDGGTPPRAYVEVKVDYDTKFPVNQPDIFTGGQQATWDEAVWDVDYWVTGSRTEGNWQGVSALGRVGAVRLRVGVLDCTFSITGWDVIYETGGIMG